MIHKDLVNVHSVNLLLDSSRGFPQHLTLDILKKGIRSHVSNVQIYLNHLMDHCIYGPFSDQESKTLYTFPSIKKLYNLDDFIIWVSFQLDGLTKSLGKDDKKPIIVAKTDGGMREFNTNDLSKMIKSISPDIVISPVDPFLLMKKDTNEYHISFNKHIEGNENDIYFGNKLLNFPTKSSKLKYLLRWESCMNRTFSLLDHLVKIKTNFSLLGSISTLQVKYSRILSESHLTERLRNSFSKFIQDLEGFSIQVDDTEIHDSYSNQLASTSIILEEIIFPLIIEMYSDDNSQFNSKRMIITFRSTRFDIQSRLIDTYKHSWKNMVQSSLCSLGVFSDIWNKIDLVFDTAFLSNNTELGLLTLPDMNSVISMNSDHYDEIDSFKNEMTNITDYHQTISSFLSTSCKCMTCSQGFHLSYIQHLFNTKEMLGKILLSCHNIHTFLEFLEKNK